VAVLGALVTAVGRAKLDQLLPALPAGKRQALADALGSGGVPGASGQVADAVREAFVAALRDGLRVGAAVALLGAVLAYALIQREPTRAEGDDAVEPASATTAGPLAEAEAEAELVSGRA
jgi:hypothetical protein